MILNHIFKSYNFLFSEILLGGKCPFVRTKKNFGQKKIVRTKTLSGQKNVRTKKLSRQILFCLRQQHSFFLSIRLLIFFCFLSNFCPYFCPIVQQSMILISEIFYYFYIYILWALVIKTCLIKLLTKLPNIPLQFLSPKVWERFF